MSQPVNNGSPYSKKQPDTRISQPVNAEDELRKQIYNLLLFHTGWDSGITLDKEVEDWMQLIQARDNQRDIEARIDTLEDVGTVACDFESDGDPQLDRSYSVCVWCGEHKYKAQHKLAKLKAELEALKKEGK